MAIEATVLIIKTVQTSAFMATKIETILTGNVIHKFTRLQNNYPENEIKLVKERMGAGQLNFRYPSVVCLFGYI